MACHGARASGLRPQGYGSPPQLNVGSSCHLEASALLHPVGLFASNGLSASSRR